MHKLNLYYLFRLSGFIIFKALKQLLCPVVKEVTMYCPVVSQSNKSLRCALSG